MPVDVVVAVAVGIDITIVESLSIAGDAGAVVKSDVGGPNQLEEQFEPIPAPCLDETLLQPSAECDRLWHEGFVCGEPGTGRI